MLTPIRVQMDTNMTSSGWSIFDTKRCCVLLYLGFYETVLECEQAINHMLDIDMEI